MKPDISKIHWVSNSGVFKQSTSGNKEFNFRKPQDANQLESEHGRVPPQLVSVYEDGSKTLLIAFRNGFTSQVELLLTDYTWKWSSSVESYTKVIKSLLNHETGNNFGFVDTGSIEKIFGLSRDKTIDELHTDTDVMLFQIYSTFLYWDEWISE